MSNEDPNDRTDDPEAEGSSLGSLARDQISEMIRLPHFGRRGGLFVLGLIAFLWGVSGFIGFSRTSRGSCNGSASGSRPKPRASIIIGPIRSKP